MSWRVDADELVISAQELRDSIDDNGQFLLSLIIAYMFQLRVHTMTEPDWDKIEHIVPLVLSELDKAI